MTQHKTADAQAMFEAGVHYGTLRSSRNPGVAKHVYGTKGNMDIIDIEVTQKQLAAAKEFLAPLIAEKKPILFVTSKNEVRDLVKTYAEKLGQMYVSGRWVGGLLTNFDNIRRRIDRMLELIDLKAKGELKKYTKKEQSLMDKEVERLEKLFGGVRELRGMPAAIVVVDPKKEFIAVQEAFDTKVPVVAIANTDCKITNITYPILANDSTPSSVEYVLHQLVA